MRCALSLPDTGALSGRCYCGKVSITCTEPPLTIAYCHCNDCKRWTGSPLPAFAAFPVGSVALTPDATPKTFGKEVTRTICPECGSPLTATFSYLPDQVYVPLGVIDQAQTLPPEIHCHADAALPWLHLVDNLPREAASAREHLNMTATS